MPSTKTMNRKADDDDTMDVLPPTVVSSSSRELTVDTTANASNNDEPRGVTPSPTLVASMTQQGFGHENSSSNEDDDDDDEVVPSPVTSSATQPVKAEAKVKRDKDDDDDDDDDVEIVGIKPAATTVPSPVASSTTPTAATSNPNPSNSNNNDPAAQAQARAEAIAAMRAAAEARRLAAIQERKMAKAKDRADQLELDDFFDAHTKDKFAGLAPYQKPEGFKSNVNLFDYQQDGVRWLIHQEKNEQERISPFWKKQKLTLGGTERWICQMGKIRLSQPERPTPDRGSVLADDMGLGKSIQTLGLILSCMPPKDDKSAPRATLIVCPVSVMASWQLQIDRFCKEGYLNVVEYHGPHRHKILTRMSRKNDIDIILASYDTLSSDFKQFEKDNEEKEEAEEEARAQKGKSNKQKKARKSAWTSSGNDSEEDWSINSESEYEDDHHLSKSMLNKKRAPSIYSFDFHRVVLDEAHRIRNGKTSSFKACSALSADRRLTITGTPFVNRPADIHSLVAFLNPPGYSSVNPLVSIKSFNELVVNPIKAFNMLGLARCRTMMSHIGLRRTKNLIDPTTLGIPSKTVEVIRVPFAEEGFHRETHDVLYKTAREVFLNMIAGGGREFYSNFYMFFSLVLRVRQSCCHGAMVPADTVEQCLEALEIIEDGGGGGEISMDADFARKMLEKLMEVLSPPSDVEEISLECAVCLDQYDQETAVCLKNCCHVFCSDCIDDLQQKVCPLCRGNFKPSDKISVEACKTAIKKKQKEEKRKKAAEKTTDWDEKEQHPKIIALLEQIELMADDEKGVIFSQFTEYLNLIEKAFDDAGHTYTRIDGSVAHPERREAMKALDSEEGPRFMLVSIRAAGEGLTLVRANVCFLMDPWWNAAVQDQAADRVHRIGQTRPVRIYQLVMKDSIEERLLTVQESKTALGNGSLRKLTKEEAKKARITAMKDLFLVDKAAKWQGRFDDDDEDDDDDGSDLDGFIVDDDDYE